MKNGVASLHKILKDETRRKIVLLLNEKGALSYTDFMKALEINNTGRLNYHLKVLNDLILKREDGQYVLSDKGKHAWCLLLEFSEKNIQPSQMKPRWRRLFWIAAGTLTVLITITNLILYGIGVVSLKLLFQSFLDTFAVAFILYLMYRVIMEVLSEKNKYSMLKTNNFRGIVKDNSVRKAERVLFGEISLGKKVNASQYPFETHVIPLHVMAALALAYLFEIYFTWFFLTNPVTVQQKGLTIFAWVTYVVFASSLFGGVVNLLFSKMAIDEERVTLVPAFMRIFRYRSFPYSFRFNEIHIKPVLGGRILVIGGAEQTDLPKRIIWSTALLGGLWVMPIKWKKSLQVIEGFQNARTPPD